MEPKNTWIKKRHAIARNLVYPFLYPYCRLKYGVTIEKFREQGDRPYLILLNHQTPFDQFFVGAAFSGAVYYMATEDIFSLGWISSLIRWLVAPIPIKKQTTDVQAVKNCIRVAREGGTLCIAPEGNRTYSGKTEYMNPAIAGLAKKLGLPIALFRIEGGYGVQPRWSDVVRRGRMTARVSQVIEREEYEALSNEELMDRIRKGLYVNEAVSSRRFLHKNRAEYLERALYICPFCGPADLESHGAVVSCKACGTAVEYSPATELVGKGRDFPFRFVNDWYEYQNSYVRGLDLSQYLQVPMFTDTADLYQVILRKRKNLLRSGSVFRLYGDRIEIDGDLCFPFRELSAVTVLGRNKLNLYHRDMVCQVKGGKRFNALKYVNIYYHSKDLRKGESNEQFLGL